MSKTDEQVKNHLSDDNDYEEMISSALQISKSISRTLDVDAQPRRRTLILNAPIMGYQGKSIAYRRTISGKSADSKDETILHVLRSDMENEMRDFVCELLLDVFVQESEKDKLKKCPSLQYMGAVIKSKLEQKEGYYWQVIMGAQFSTSLITKSGYFLYFRIREFRGIIFKS
ncbi:hypothetical protein GJ496_006564 [Pomphorhynchus laevis]|nr:hypothetical protein GJ496_006564 [Pomphorhynchus laevis]